MYEKCVREIEYGSFTPLVFSCSGGMGPLASIVYKRLASLVSKKSSQTYSMILYWLRCKLSFSLLYSAITYLRGFKSSYHRFKFSDSAINALWVTWNLMTFVVTFIITCFDSVRKKCCEKRYGHTQDYLLSHIQIPHGYTYSFCNIRQNLAGYS